MKQSHLSFWFPVISYLSLFSVLSSVLLSALQQEKYGFSNQCHSDRTCLRWHVSHVWVHSLHDSCFHSKLRNCGRKILIFLGSLYSSSCSLFQHISLNFNMVDGSLGRLEIHQRRVSVLLRNHRFYLVVTTVVSLWWSNPLFPKGYSWSFRHEWIKLPCVVAMAS